MKNWLILCVAALLNLSAQAAALVFDANWKDSGRERVIPIKVRVAEGEATLPLVIFSHGLGGSREGGRAWGEHWSAHGYMVIHVQHPGSDEALWRGSADGSPKQRITRGATPEQLLGRVDDVRFVIDELTRLQRAPDAAAWVKRVDLTRIAMTGHSFGALTTVALAGERFPGPIKSVADARISAFIAFSPSVQGAKRTWPERYGAMSQPFLTVTGTIDGDVLGNGNSAKRRAALFDEQAPGEKYRVIFANGDHSVFNGGNLGEAEWLNRVTGENHQSTSAATAKLIQEKAAGITLRFLDAHLKRDASAKGWLVNEAQAWLGDAGAWSRK